MKETNPIGIFDSGVGGISVLARALISLPGENFIYYADTANFPYGDKEPAIIKKGLCQAAETMNAKGIKTMVVACNTATSVAIEDIRACYDFPILGMEPALKPAVEKAENKRVAVLATALTLRESKFHKLLAKCQSRGQIINLPAPGLADLVEQGHYNDAEGEKYLTQLFQGLKDIDVIVLGCTHYLFLLPLIQKYFPQAEIIDGGLGTVRHLAHVLAEHNLKTKATKGNIEVMTTNPSVFLPRFQGHLDYITAILKQNNNI